MLKWKSQILFFFLEAGTMFFKNSCSQRFHKNHKKTPLLDSIFLKTASLKKRLRHKCFLANFAKFLRAPFLQNTSGRLLLKRSKDYMYKLLTGNLLVITKLREMHGNWINKPPKQYVNLMILFFYPIFLPQLYLQGFISEKAVS